MSETFPWRTIMAAGLGRLHLSSAAFWAMTPRELVAAVDGLRGRSGEPPARAEFEDLMRRYPDADLLVRSTLGDGH